MSLSNSRPRRRQLRRGCAFGEKWVRRGAGGATVIPPRPTQVAGEREPGLLACGAAPAGWTPQKLLGAPVLQGAVSHFGGGHIPSLPPPAESPAPLITSSRAPPCRVLPCALLFSGCSRCFRGAHMLGGANAGCPTAEVGAKTPSPPSSFLCVSPPPGGEPEFLRCPEFPVLSSGGRGGWVLWSLPGGSPCRVLRVGLAWVFFFFLRWHQLPRPARRLVWRPLVMLRGDYLLAAALLSPGHEAVRAAGRVTCAGKPQSPGSRGGTMGERDRWLSPRASVNSSGTGSGARCGGPARVRQGNRQSRLRPRRPPAMSRAMGRTLPR